MPGDLSQPLGPDTFFGWEVLRLGLHLFSFHLGEIYYGFPGVDIASVHEFTLRPGVSFREPSVPFYLGALDSCCPSPGGTDGVVTPLGIPVSWRLDPIPLSSVRVISSSSYLLD